MKKSDIYEIAIKILGLYLVIIVIGQLREVMMYLTILTQTKNNPDAFNGLDQPLLYIVIIFSFLILTAFSGLLIFRTKQLTKLICKKEDFEENVKISLNKKTIYEIALTIVGMLTFILILPDFAFKLKNYVQLLQNETSDGYDTSFLLTSGLKIIVGILAIIYSKPISIYLAADNNEPNDQDA